MDNVNNKFLGADIIPVLKAKVDAKQDKLTSGVNIKTINNVDVLGAGNIELPTAKLYQEYGDNTDGALTQKFASEKMQAAEGKISNLETTTTGLTTKDTELEGRIKAIEDKAPASEEKVEEIEGDVENLKTVANTEVVQKDMAVSGDDSTVTITKKLGALTASTTTDTGLPLPVASKTAAGVINPATYTTIYDTADALEAIEGAAVAVTGLAATAKDADVTAAWKEATGKDTLINGATVLDVDNDKTWTYYTNTQKWYSQDNTNPTIEIADFTNDQAGLIKGSDTDGKVYAESDGTGSVKGWDTVKADISNNKSAIEGINTTIAGLDDVYYGKEEGESLASDLAELETKVEEQGEDKQDELVSGTNIKTINNQSVLGAGNIAVQEVLVSGTNIATINGQSLLSGNDITVSTATAMTTAEFEQLWSAA